MVALVTIFALNLQYPLILADTVSQEQILQTLEMKIVHLELKLQAKSSEVDQIRIQLNTKNESNSLNDAMNLKPVKCVGGEVKQRFKTEVVMFIPTPVPWTERRSYVLKQFLREKWARSQVVLVFVFGTRTGPRLEHEINTSSVEQERVPGVDYFFSPCRDFGDEENNPNGTSSTTCKVFEACKYIVQAYDAEYVWRGADDSYVNLRRFLRDKHALPSTRLFLGHQRRATEPAPDLQLRASHPRLQELLGIYQFGQYMMGLGYVFSWDVAEFIGTWAIPPHQTWCEDVMVGMWLNPFQIRWVGTGLRYGPALRPPLHGPRPLGPHRRRRPPRRPPPPAPAQVTAPSHPLPLRVTLRARDPWPSGQSDSLRLAGDGNARSREGGRNARSREGGRNARTNSRRFA